MTDPMRPRDRLPPRRATPLQPDKPGSGNRSEPTGERPQPPASRGGGAGAVDKLREQERGAVDNAREGYD